MANSFKTNVLYLLMLITGGTLYAQQTVTGTVTDELGPLAGANVIIKGTSTGTTTDFDGNFTLNNVSGDAVLILSYLGYRTQEVPVNNRTTINVQMEADMGALDEVVVVGYGTQSRAAVTGAISTVSEEDITALPVTNAEQALQGRAPGVTIINSGSPGTSPVVRIRGLGTPNNNNPLYVIDGVITGGLGALNPNDIESVQILKDASTTAVYGSKGSNGVVIVTTKKGTKGATKPRLTLDSYTGVQYNPERYDVLNTAEYIQYARDIVDPDPERITNPAYADFIDNETNWQDEIFRTGIIQSHTLGLSGGGTNANYRFSAGYLDQEGAVIETEFKRYSFRANSNFDFGRLRFGETMTVAFNSQNPERNAGGRSLIEHAIKAAPYLAIYNPNNPGGFQGPNSALDAQDAENAVRVQTLGYALNKSIAILGNVFGEFDIIDGLTFKTQVGIDYFKFNNNAFTPSFRDDSNGGTHQQNFALITKNGGTSQSLLFTNSLSYKKTFADVHNLEVLLLAEEQELKFEAVNASSQNAISNEIDQLSLENAALSSNSSEYNRIGYLGRINYDYDEKYLLAASIRRDASSRFGANNRWGWFPSVAAGWNIAKEGFMQDTPFNNLKLRGSWGVTGNDNIGDYRYSSVIVQNYLYVINDGLVQGVTSGGLGNPDLKWEETSMFNVGLDVGMFENKFTATLEYYQNTSDDLLIDRPIPLSLGFHNPFITENVGSVETTGFEINLGYNDFEGDFTWSANFNLGTSINEVKSLGPVATTAFEGAFFETDNLTRISVGEPLFYFYGYEMDGIYQTQAEVDEVFFNDPGTSVQPGDIRYVDQNNDGTINAEDKVQIGNPYPDFTFGLNLSAEYKNLDLNLFINGSVGNDIYNTNLYDLEGMPRLFNSGVAVLDRWTGPGTSNTIPRALGNTANTQASTRFLEDGSFTRLKNITIGYTFNNGFLTETFDKFRLYLSGQNLITVTDYSGLDPEIGLSPLQGGNQFELGIDRGNYPQPKSILLGVQVAF